MSAAQVEAAEAVCGALYRLPFTEFLGEHTDPRGEWSGWFHFGERPKDMRVTVRRPVERETVEVVAEWRNYAADARNPLKGQQTLTVSTYGQSQVEHAVEQAVVRVLELYRDVLGETGVAGKISELAEPEPG